MVDRHQSGVAVSRRGSGRAFAFRVVSIYETQGTRQCLRLPEAQARRGF